MVWIKQRRLGFLLILYDLVLVCWLIYKSVMVSADTKNIRFTPFMAATFLQVGITLITVPTFMIASLEQHVRKISNVYITVLLIRGTFLTPILLINFVHKNKLILGVFVAAGNATMTLLFIFLLSLWATSILSPRIKRSSEDLHDSTLTDSLVDIHIVERRSTLSLHSGNTVGPFEHEEDLPNYEELMKGGEILMKQTTVTDTTAENDLPPPSYEDATKYYL